MKNPIRKNIGFKFAAAVAALCFNGCMTDESGDVETATETQSSETSPAGGTPAADKASKTKAMTDAVVDWLKPYQAGLQFVVENDGDDVYIRGAVGQFPSVFSKYDIVVHLDLENRDACCYGHLPTRVPEENRAEMVEFLFRAELAYGLSSAMLVLDDQGSVRCQAWCPFSELENHPDKALPELIGSVIEKLFAVSHGAGRVIIGDADPDAASSVGRVEIFKRGAFDNKADTEAVIRACFDEGGYETGEDAADWFSSRFAGGDESVGIIKSSIFEVKKEMGGVFDSLDYALIVRDGRVSDVCPAPVEIPEDKLAEVADAAMRLNQVMRCGLFRVDFDNGKLWCQYSVPVSALTENADSERTRFNRASIRVMAAAVMAKNSEAFSKILKGE
jgi:hypothetical protein